MTSAITIRRLPRETWDAATPLFRDVSYRQIGGYATAAAQRVGANSELNGLFEGETLIGLADVRVKTVPLTNLGIGYLSHAPIISADGSFCIERFSRCVEAIRKEYVGRRRLLLRLVPALIGGQFQQLQITALEAQGFRACLGQKPRETFLLDLKDSTAALRANTDHHWRRNLAKGEKTGVEITRSVQLEDFDKFERIFLELTKQKNFKANQDVRFFKDVQSDVPERQKLILHLAWHGRELVAGHLGSFVGDTAIYLLGAANAKGRDSRASYLLHWAVIEYARSVGNVYYDLGGIDQDQNPGVYRFKKGFNGRPVADVGPFECSPDTVRRGLLHLLEGARNMMQRS
jgi:lipid II:glycine glycyltransferase (peptidoglycan interpeptide bridge formation enzyme)